MCLFLMEHNVTNGVEVGDLDVLGKFASMYTETCVYPLNFSAFFEEVAYLV